MAGATAGSVSDTWDDTRRPTTLLSVPQLLQISMFWFALNMIWGGFEVFQQVRVGQLTASWAPLPLVGGLMVQDWKGVALGIMELVAMFVAALTMPIAGSISDYTSSRWGRRKPYILFGALATVLAFLAVTAAPTFVLLILAFALLQWTSNVARGPFAGLVPDLVPEPQVGRASGLMGLMLMLGLGAGFLVAGTGIPTGEFTVQMVLIGLVIGATGIGTVLWVPNGPPGKERHGRSWGSVAKETFGTDILDQHDYVFLLGSRFCILMGAGFFLNVSLIYLTDVMRIPNTDVHVLGLKLSQQQLWIYAAMAVSTLASAIGTLPSARLSDRVGRKPVIYASTAVGATGSAIIAAAPEPAYVLVGSALMGLAAGIFLSVDWALMTEIIPKASAGRYMGLSNIVEATNGPVGTALVGLLWALIGAALGTVAGGRISIFAATGVFALGAVLLHPVHEPRRAIAPTAPLPRPARSPQLPATRK